MSLDFPQNVTPDMEKVIDDHFVCSRCHSFTRTVDPREALTQVRIRQHRRRFIRLHGTTQYCQFVSVLETIIDQMTHSEKMDYVLLQCLSCFHLGVIKIQSLAAFLTQVQDSEEWGPESRVSLNHQQFVIWKEE